jgi:MFS family permease
MRTFSQQSVVGPGASKPTLSTRYKWWVVFMLWFVCFLNYSDRQAIFSVFPKLTEEFGFDKVQLGLIGSAFMWVYAAAAPATGFAGDRLPRKHLILGGCLFWSLVTMMTGWCGKLWQFLAVRAFEGLGESFYFPASTSLMSDYHGKRTRSRALAIHNSGVYLGTIAGGWLGAWFAVHAGWRWGFYWFGGMGVLLAIILSRFLREPARGQAEPDSPKTPSTDVPTQLTWRETASVIFQNPIALLLLAAFVGANFVAAIFLTWTPTFLVEKFHFQLTSAGFSGSIFIHLASALSVPIGGWLADRWANRHPGGRMLVQAIGLFLGSTFVFLVGMTQSVGVLLVAMSLFGACKGLYDSNIFASIFDVVHPRARGSAAGIMNTVGWGGGALGPLAVGWISKHGRHANEMDNMSEAIAFCSLIYIAGAGLLLAASALAGRTAPKPPFQPSRANEA